MSVEYLASRATPTMVTVLLSSRNVRPTASPMDAPDTPTEIEISFKKGDAIALNGKALAVGEGRSKKAAEQQAAKAALTKLEQQA